jgi:integrase
MDPGGSARFHAGSSRTGLTVANIEKRETTRGVRYDVRYRTPGGAVRTRTFKRRKDADAHKSLVEADLLRGEWCDPRLGRIAFSDWTDRWRATTVSLRPSTRARDDSYLRSLILPRFGERSLAEIDRAAIRAWVAELSGTHAPATVVKAHQILSKIMGAAVDDGMLPSNPCARVPLPRLERKEMRFLGPAEVAALADAVDQRYRALVMLGCYGGLRAGELLGLRARSVDPLRARVDVCEICVEVRGEITFGPPKTRAGRRSVPLPRSIADALSDHLRGLGAGADELVFPAPEGGPVRLSLWRRRFWAPAVRSAGLEPLRIHDMRHTAVALWIAAGASPYEIASRAGHTSVAVVLDRYGHLLPGSEERVNEALDELARGLGGSARAIDAR